MKKTITMTLAVTLACIVTIGIKAEREPSPLLIVELTRRDMEDLGLEFETLKQSLYDKNKDRFNNIKSKLLGDLEQAKERLGHRIARMKKVDIEASRLLRRVQYELEDKIDSLRTLHYNPNQFILPLLITSTANPRMISITLDEIEELLKAKSYTMMATVKEEKNIIL